jgi:prepilin-type N-terminal cleavage/methylation domain-containing protein
MVERTMRMQNKQAYSARDLQSGFTMLELMVVVAIFGVLVVAGAASMKLAERPAVLQAVHYIENDIIRARNEAAKDEDRCRFTFDFSQNGRGYTYVMQNSGRTKTVSLQSRWRDEVFFLPGSPGAPDPAPDATFAFTPRGELDKGSNGRIYVTDRSGFFSGTGKVYRIMTSLSGEVESRVRDFNNATWFDF